MKKDLCYSIVVVLLFVACMQPARAADSGNAPTCDPTKDKNCLSQKGQIHFED
jgi:hypothetical protein